jgi:hypothetical protein
MKSTSWAKSHDQSSASSQHIQDTGRVSEDVQEYAGVPKICWLLRDFDYPRLPAKEPQLGDLGAPLLVCVFHFGIEGARQNFNVAE